MTRRLILIVLALTALACGDGAGQENELARRDARIAELQRRTGKPGEAEDRRQRSMARLRAENVPILPTLPVIATEAESRRRQAREVAERAVALAIVALRSDSAPADEVSALTSRYHADAYYSPAEREYMANPEPTEHDRIQFQWRIEGACVLLWAVGHAKRIGTPREGCDSRQILKFLMQRGPDEVIGGARLRPQGELLDADDLYYRYHWATREAEIRGKPIPAGLDADAVREQHYALNWLVGYMDQEWDVVTADT